jgi:lipopolysaccharide transport system ATP-binding protein
MPKIITVENISKLYHIGAHEHQGGSLRESLTAALRHPLSLVRRNGNTRGEELWALKDVSFDVEQGEIIGIIGRNGAGKSTLLKILSRITKPTTGRIEIDGRVGSLLEVGTGFHPELTGRDNIFLNGAMLGMGRHEIGRKFDEIVAFSEIERFIDTPVKRYSSGMYTRLAFAIAAHLEPEILIVDEVLAVGDLAFQKKCLGKMGGAAKEGRTVLFVSHAMEAVRKLCGRGILLDGGEIVAQGRIEDVIAKYVEDGAGAQAVYEIPRPTDIEEIPGYAYKLTVEDGEGHPTTSIPVGKPWQVRIHFQIKRRVEHFIIAIGLLTNLNTALRTCWAEPRDIEPGNYEAVFREETIWLGAGRYSITLGLSTFERSFHYITDVGVIDIADFAEGVDLVRVSNHGYVLNPFQIEIQKLGP